MLRRPFTLLSTLSLLLCVATGGLWVRSTAMKTGDRFGWTKVAGEAGRRAEISSVDGEISYAHDTAGGPLFCAGGGRGGGGGGGGRGRGWGGRARGRLLLEPRGGEGDREGRCAF